MISKLLSHICGALAKQYWFSTSRRLTEVQHVLCGLHSERFSQKALPVKHRFPSSQAFPLLPCARRKNCIKKNAHRVVYFKNTFFLRDARNVPVNDELRSSKQCAFLVKRASLYPDRCACLMIVRRLPRSVWYLKPVLALRYVGCPFSTILLLCRFIHRITKARSAQSHASLYFSFYLISPSFTTQWRMIFFEASFCFPTFWHGLWSVNFLALRLRNPDRCDALHTFLSYMIQLALIVPLPPRYAYKNGGTSCMSLIFVLS